MWCSSRRASRPSTWIRSSSEQPRWCASAIRLGEDRAGGVDDLRARAVVEGEREGGAGVARGGLGRPLHGVLHFAGQLVDAADVFHADVVVVHALDVADEVAPQQLHQEVDLGLGAAQVVLEREGVEGDEGQVDARGGLDDELDAFGALLVAEEALQRALASPAAVAVHDDGDVLGNLVGVKLRVKCGLFRREFVQARAGFKDRPGCGCAQNKRPRRV